MSWDYNGTFLSTSSLDGTLKVWRLNVTPLHSNSDRRIRREEEPLSQTSKFESLIEIPREPLQQVLHINLKDLIEVEHDGIYGSLISPNALFITTLIRFDRSIHVFHSLTYHQLLFLWKRLNFQFI
jgi:WD40 repeat protein